MSDRIKNYHSLIENNFQERLGIALRRFEELRQPHKYPEFDLRKFIRVIETLSNQQYYSLFNRIVYCPSAPWESLEALESFNSFCANFLLDDSACQIVPDPLYKDSLNPPLTLVPYRGNGSIANQFDIIKAIAHNFRCDREYKEKFKKFKSYISGEKR